MASEPLSHDSPRPNHAAVCATLTLAGCEAMWNRRSGLPEIMYEGHRWMCYSTGSTWLPTGGGSAAYVVPVVWSFIDIHQLQMFIEQILEK